MLKVHDNDRFVTITGTKIHDLWKKVPGDLGGYAIDVYYKKNDKDFLGEHMTIRVKDRKFIEEVAEIISKKRGSDKRGYYTNGMTDIDVYMQNDQLVLYWSPHDGRYIYFHFDKDEWVKLKNWIDMELKNANDNG